MKPPQAIWPWIIHLPSPDPSRPGLVVPLPFPASCGCPFCRAVRRSFSPGAFPYPSLSEPANQ